MYNDSVQQYDLITNDYKGNSEKRLNDANKQATYYNVNLYIE